MNYIHTLLILGTKPHSASDVASHIKAADTVWVKQPVMLPLLFINLLPAEITGKLAGTVNWLLKMKAALPTLTLAH